MSTVHSFWHSGLTGPHLDIAAYPGTPLRVMAEPGTGKTLAIMLTIERSLETGLSPASILAVTFTRTAARDQVEQLNRLGSAEASGTSCATVLRVNAAQSADDQEAADRQVMELVAGSDDSPSYRTRAHTLYNRKCDSPYCRTTTTTADLPTTGGQVE